MSVRANFKTYKNNKYTGLISHEYKCLFDVTSDQHVDYTIDGDVYRVEKTIFNQQMLGFLVNDVMTAQFCLSASGSYSNYDSALFPYLRGVPNFTQTELSIGQTYSGKGDYLINIDAYQDTLPIRTSTIYLGKKAFYGKEYDYFEMSYSYLPSNTSLMQSTKNFHKVRIFFDNVCGLPAYIEDKFVDEFMIKGNMFKRDGFVLYFYDIDEPIDPIKLMDDLSDDIDDDIKINTDNGIRFVLDTLKFKPNSAELIDGESYKIDNIYKILSKITDKDLLIEGHCALAGTADEMLQISIDRARTIVSELVARGIDAKRLLYTGKGASQPVAPNDTEDNKRKNRRVEIKIL